MADQSLPQAEPAPRPLEYRKWEGLPLPRIWTVIGVVALILALAGGWWGWRKYSTKRAAQAVDAIRKAGAIVLMDPKNPAKVDRIYLNDLGDQRIVDMSRDLAWLGPVREVDFVGQRISDDAVAAVLDMKRVDVVFIFNTRITQKGVDALKKAHPRVQVKTGKPDPVGTQLAGANIHRHAIVTLAFADDGRLFTGSGDGKLRVWDTRRREVLQTVNAHEKWLFSLAISPGKDLLATGGGDSVIRLWDPRTLEPRGELRGHTDDVHGVVFGPTGDTLVSAGDDKTLRVWDVKSATERLVLRGHKRAIPSLARMAGGRHVVSGSRDGTLIAWDVATGTMLWKGAGHASDVNQVAVSGDRVASASYDGTVRLWQGGREIAKATGHKGRVYSVSVDPDGRTIYSAGEDGLVRGWDVTADGLTEVDLARRQTLVATMAFDRDGRMVTAGADGQVKFWSDPFREEALVLVPRFED